MAVSFTESLNPDSNSSMISSMTSGISASSSSRYSSPREFFATAFSPYEKFSLLSVPV